MAAASDFVERHLGPARWTDADVTRVVLATLEAAANAVEHAGGSSITVGCRVSPGEAVVCVSDEGPGPGAAALHVAGLPSDPLATSGRGLHILRQLSDEAEVVGGALVLRFWPRESR